MISFRYKVFMCQMDNWMNKHIKPLILFDIELHLEVDNRNCQKSISFVVDIMSQVIYFDYGRLISKRQAC